MAWLRFQYKYELKKRRYKKCAGGFVTINKRIWGISARAQLDVILSYKKNHTLHYYLLEFYAIVDAYAASTTMTGTTMFFGLISEIHRY